MTTNPEQTTHSVPSNHTPNLDSLSSNFYSYSFQYNPSIQQNVVNSEIAPSFANTTLKSIVDEVDSIFLDFDHQEFTNAFSNVYNSIQNAYQLNKHLKKRIQGWKKTYDELTMQNAKKDYLFCLDSFFFQYKIFVFEIEHFTKYLAFLNHRIYGDYYRLYLDIMHKYSYSNGTSSNGTSSSKDASMNLIIQDISQVIPKFKEMEPFFEYKVKDIDLIHSTVIASLQNLYDYFYRRHDEMIQYKNTMAVGYSIFPFLNQLKYEITLLKEQITMYQNNLLFFYESHNSFITILSLKMKDFESNLNAQFQVLIGDMEEDVDIDDTISNRASESLCSDMSYTEIYAESDLSNRLNIIYTDGTHPDDVFQMTNPNL